MFVGVDWASEEHSVCVVEDAGTTVSKFVVAHSEEGLESLLGRLKQLDEPKNLPVAIERPDGRLVDRLLEAGHPVVAVKSNAIKQWREAEVISGAKSDPGDAEVIAQYLRLNFHRLSCIRPYSDQTVALRCLVRTRTDLVDQRMAAQNQLAALLDKFWPGPKKLFNELSSEISLRFLERYPTPPSAASLGEGRMRQFLKKNSYPGRCDPKELVRRLRAAPKGVTHPAVSDACGDAVVALVRVIRELNRSIKDLEGSISAQLGEHPDAEIFTSLPRSATITAAQMLAEWGDCRQAYDDPEAVSALSGMSPVTKRSGKHYSVQFRWACNKRFRNVMHIFADNSRHASPWAADIYERARGRGQEHAHAIRTLARAWIRVIWRCWIDRVPYNAGLHGGAQRFLEKKGVIEFAA